MNSSEFIERYEVQGLTIQVEEVEQDEWLLRAMDRTGAVIASHPISKETVQELYATNHLDQMGDVEEST